jgi:tetratricopeptide (TPR) repeat protein
MRKKSAKKGQEILEEAERFVEAKMYSKAAEKIQCFFSQHDEKAYPILSRLFGSLYTLFGIYCFHLKEETAPLYLSHAVEFLTGTSEILYLSKAYNHLSLLKYAEKNYKEMENLLIKADSVLGNMNSSNVCVKLNISYNLSFCYYIQKQYHKCLELIHNILDYCEKMNYSSVMAISKCWRRFHTKISIIWKKP